MGEYNNGRPISIPEGEEEKSLAISEWAEGNIHLENALRNCIENGVPTFASCASHDNHDDPYLAVVITKENLGKILNIMSSLVQNGKLLKSISLSPNLMPGQNNHIFTAHLKNIRKNEGFDLMAEATTQEPIKLEEADDLVQEMWKSYKVLCQNCNGIYKAEYYNELIIKRFNMQYNIIEGNGQALSEKMDSLGIKKPKYFVGSFYNREYNIRALDTETLAQKMSDINDELMIQYLNPAQRSFEEEIKVDSTSESNTLEHLESEKKDLEEQATSHPNNSLNTGVTDDSDDLEL